jgi:hypothetical protein
VNIFCLGNRTRRSAAKVWYASSADESPFTSPNHAPPPVHGICPRFPGINWGAARASKLESRRPVSAIRGKPLSESWPTVTGLRVWHSLKIRQSIDVLDLTGIAHVSPVRTLRQLVTQVRHGDVRAVLLKQPVNPVLPSSAALVAHEAYIPQVRRTIWDEFSMQFYA